MQYEINSNSTLVCYQNYLNEVGDHVLLKNPEIYLECNSNKN